MPDANLVPEFRIPRDESVSGFAAESGIHSVAGGANDVLNRWFKRRVYETNYSNIEKVLLMKLNSQFTLRLLLRNAFRNKDPELTKDIQTLYQHCPTLFNRALARSDQREIEQAQFHDDQGLDDDFELEVPISANAVHQDPVVINHIPAKEMKNVTHPITISDEARAQGEAHEPLPLKASQMSLHFLQQMRLAWQLDYGQGEHYPSAYEEQAAIQYARKCAFDRPATNEEEAHRFVFSKGDAIVYHGSDFGLINHIFLFDVYGARFVFLVVTPLARDGETDHILGLEVMHEQEDAPTIIGITAIEPQQPYVVEVPDVGHVLNDWDIKTL